MGGSMTLHEAVFAHLAASGVEVANGEARRLVRDGRVVVNGVTIYEEGFPVMDADVLTVRPPPQSPAPTLEIQRSEREEDPFFEHIRTCVRYSVYRASLCRRP